MTIKAILEQYPHPIVTIGPQASVAEAVALLAEKRIGALPVVDGDTVLGIFSERDVIYCLARDGAAMLAMRVAEVMTAPVVSTEPERSVLNALSLMTKRRIRHLPVVARERLAGFVSIGDLVKYRIEKIEAEAEAMREYIQTA